MSNSVVMSPHGVLPVVSLVMNRGYAMTTRSKNVACVGRRRRMSAITADSLYVGHPFAIIARKARLAIPPRGWGGDSLDMSTDAR
jgi:hypothetical protein